MNKEDRLELEQELLLTCSKAQAINKYIDELEENKQLKEDRKVLFEENHNKEEVIIKYQDSWNKLKEILSNVSKHYKNQFQLFSANCCEHILEIMQELEKGDSNE